MDATTKKKQVEIEKKRTIRLGAVGTLATDTTPPAPAEGNNTTVHHQP